MSPIHSSYRKSKTLYSNGIVITLENVIIQLQNNLNLFTDKILTHLGYYIACYIFIEIIKSVNYLRSRNS
jgi:hypothetical protein